MNDQKIYELMFRTPNIRAVQISDALDADLGEVSRALRPLVDIGDVVQHKGVAPNGQPALMYNLSDDFKKSRQYADLVAAAAAAAKPTQAPAAPATAEERGVELMQVMVPSMAAATLAPTPTPTESPTAAPATEPPCAGRSERAIAHIVGNGSATDQALREVMGIRPEEYPSSYLSHAVRAGRVMKKGSLWVPGNGAPVEPDRAPPFGSRLNLPGSTPKPTAAPARKAAPQAPEPAAVQPIAPTFRCGLWSDGVLELQRNGVTVATLEPTESKVMLNFIDGAMLSRGEP